MERKWLIAIILIAIIVVGVLGWYFLFGTPQQEQTTGPMLYVDGIPYNSTSITWNLTATPGATFYSFHNATNPGNATVDAFFNYTASFYNVSSFQWTQIYNGKKWLISNQNVTASLVFANSTLSPLLIQLFHREVGELTTYFVYVNYTDQMLNIKFQYPGDQPAVDGQTVFTYLGFDGNANGILDASDQAFNFTNNPTRANTNMLQKYTPANISAWNTVANKTWSWNGTNLPSDMPVTVAITNNRKNVTWTIPYEVIGASKDSYIRVVIQAFGYDFFPTGATQTTPPTPSKYYQLACLFPAPGTPFKFTVQALTTTPVRFYFKVTFSANAIAGTQYTFNFTATIPS